MAGIIWIIGSCAFVLLAGLFFVLGAAVGASVSYDQFAGLIIPLLSTAGSWVAGIGALGAVVVSLWLSDRQRREDIEGVKINNSVECTLDLDTYSSQTWRITLDVVSTGRRPVTITKFQFHSKKKSILFPLADRYVYGEKLPVTLGYGEVVQWRIDIDIVPMLNRYADPEDLYIKVFSTFAEYSQDISVSTKAVLSSPEKYC